MQCLQSCSKNEYADDKACFPCNETCRGCTGPTSMDCIQCSNYKVFLVSIIISGNRKSFSSLMFILGTKLIRGRPDKVSVMIHYPPTQNGASCTKEATDRVPSFVLPVVFFRNFTKLMDLVPDSLPCMLQLTLLFCCS